MRINCLYLKNMTNEVKTVQINDNKHSPSDDYQTKTMFRVKVLVAGPTNSGKTIISNFLAEATDISSGDYHPTQGVRILEFESDSLNVNGRIVKADVELWDCSGDSKFENCWPALMKDANGIVFVYCSDARNVEREMDMWYTNFAQSQGLKEAQCIVFCHHKPEGGHGHSSQLSGLLSRLVCVHTNIEENGGMVRREFNAYLQRLMSTISEKREQEELIIMNQN